MKTKGSVLIITLWSLFILGALAVAISGYVRAQIGIAGRFSANSRSYYLAKAGAEMAVAIVKVLPKDGYETLGGKWSNNDESFKEAAFGDGAYSVTSFPEAKDGADAKYGMSDEESKINVNSAPIDILKDLLEIAGGADVEDAYNIAASIVNWRSPEDQALKEGAGAFYYSTLSRPYKCKNAPMESLEELVLVKGVTRSMYYKLKSYITLYGGGAVNINTAGPVVLRSLGMSELLADKIMNFRKGETENIFDDISTVVGVLKEKQSISAEESGIISDLIAKNLLSVNSDNFSGTAVGFMGSSRAAGAARIEFVFDRKNNALRYWRE